MAQTNTSLIRRVRDAQDLDSWREFLDLYEPLLLSYVRSRGLNEADARDVVQEVFIALVKALPNFGLDHERGRFRTWLYQITINRVRDLKRRVGTYDRMKEGLRGTSQITDVTNEKPDADWLAAHRQRVMEFVLPKVQAATLAKTWLCFEQQVLKGRKTADIAAELGITANAVSVNAGRVMDKVRKLCADYMEDLDDD